MSAGAGASALSSSSLGGIFTNIPAGVSPYSYLKNYLETAIFLLPTGYFLFQTYLFIAIHALIAIISVYGCYVRYSKNNFWFFRYRNHYVCPNTSILSQLMFACYSILYIVSLVTNSLSRPTVTAYALSLAAYIPLGLAIHTQTWSTLVASSPFRRIGPKSMNFLMIFIGILFTLSIIAGRVIATIVREQMMMSWRIISSGLDSAEAENAPITSLSTLFPELQILMELGERLRHVELTLGKIWASWAALWIFTYIPAAFFLLRTLRKQEKVLRRSLRNLDVLDQLVTQAASEDSPISPFSELEKFPSFPSATYNPEEKSNLPPLSSLRSPTRGTPRRLSTRANGSHPPLVTVQVSRTAIQKEEVSGKLSNTKRMKEIILYQLIATTIMLFAYTIILIISERPQFQEEYTPLTQIHITDTMLGWAFACPALFSSAGFLYVSIKAPRIPNAFTKLDQTLISTPSTPKRPSFFTFASFSIAATNKTTNSSNGRSTPLTSKETPLASEVDSVWPQSPRSKKSIRNSNRDSFGITEITNDSELVERDSSEMESEPVRLANRSWIPSKWVKEKEEEEGDIMELGLRSSNNIVER